MGHGADFCNQCGTAQENKMESYFCDDIGWGIKSISSTYIRKI